AEVVQGEVAREDRGRRERVVGVERRRDDVHDREQRDDDRDDPDEMPPPRLAERRTAPRLLDVGLRDGRDARCRDRRWCGSCFAHLSVSNDLERQNVTAEMPATMKKMMIAPELARP